MRPTAGLGFGFGWAGGEQEGKVGVRGWELLSLALINPEQQSAVEETLSDSQMDYTYRQTDRYR